MAVDVDIQAVANTLNSKPRKTLGWKTPAEALDEYLNLFNKLVLRRPVEFAQYTSEDFQRLLESHGIVCSMSRRGNCWDTQSMMSLNACPI